MVDPELLLRQPSIWRVEQYDGALGANVEATQLAPNQAATPSEARRILRAWIEFFASTSTSLTHLNLVSRTPQELLDAVGQQSQLEHLRVKWGPYSDLTALSRLGTLTSLFLGGAVSVRDLTPLTALRALDRLVIEQPYRVDDLSPVGALGSLRDLTIGGSIGSDRVVHIRSLEWIRPLTGLRSLELPGTSLRDADLGVLLTLPELETLRIPLRNSYRAQVFEYAEISAAFAGVASDYQHHDAAWAGIKRG